MRHLTSTLVALTLVVGCGNSTSPPPTPSASAPIAVVSAPGAADADAGLPSLKPSTLARKGSPRDRRLADEKACDGGDAVACRRVADRYRGYTPAATAPTANPSTAKSARAPASPSYARRRHR